MAGAVNMIGHRSPVEDHTQKPKVRALVKQPQHVDEKWGLAISQRQEQCRQSLQKVASTLTITTGLCRHGIPMQ
jgi:hypothetical protein